MSEGIFFTDPSLIISYIETGLIPVIIGWLQWERREDKREQYKGMSEQMENLSDLIKEDIKLTQKLILIIDERIRK